MGTGPIPATKKALEKAKIRCRRFGFSGGK